MQDRLNPEFKIQVDNVSDYGGNVADTFGVSLFGSNGVDSRKGEIVSGKKLFPNSVSMDSGLSGIGLIQSFIFTDADGGGKYWAADGSKVYKTVSPAGTKYAADALANTPTSVNGDMVVFGRTGGKDNLIVPKSTDLAKLNTSWDPTWWTVTLGQTALSGTAPHTLVVFPNPFLLLIPDGNMIHSVDQANIAIYARVSLPTNHTIKWSKYANGLAYFGISTADKTSGGVWEYDPVNEKATFYSYDLNGGDPGTPFVVNNHLYAVTSDGRVKSFTGTGFSTYAETIASKRNSQLVMHRNGIAVDGTKVYMLTQGASGLYPAGVLVMDLVDGNLYHHAPIVTGTGDAGQYTASGGTGALWTDGQFLIGGVLATNLNGIFMSTNAFAATVATRTWVVTRKIPSTELEDAMAAVWAFFSIFGTESILLKCRTVENQNGRPNGAVSVTATWTSTIVFTTTDDLSEVKDGDEVIINIGTNGCLSAHISGAPSLSSGTYTVTLDEGIGLGSGTSSVQINNWKKVIAASNVLEQLKEMNIPFAQQTFQWVQFKVEIRGTTSSLKGLSLDKQNLKRIL